MKGQESYGGWAVPGITSSRFLRAGDMKIANAGGRSG